MSMQSLPVVKLGMWGGNEGRYHDHSVMPRRLLTMTVRCGEAIDSIEFSYIGVDLKEHEYFACALAHFACFLIK